MLPSCVVDLCRPRQLRTYVDMADSTYVEGLTAGPAGDVKSPYIHAIPL